MKELAPIVLFAYNRPEHTEMVLNALAQNNESAKSNLYVFCDGPKQNVKSRELNNINKVRKIVFKEDRFKSVKVIVNHSNKGLSKSIIEGVNMVIKEHKKIIVLEDDILVGSGFLKYMNGALNLYEEIPNVGCIHAWNYYFKNLSDVKEATFFLKGADCWGWATWENRWIHLEENGLKLLTEIKKRNLDFSFDRNGTHSFMEILQDQINKKNDSWAIRWHASLFLNGMYCLHPTIPVVKNIGLDSTGTHCKESSFKQIYKDELELKQIEVKEAQWFFKKYKAEYLKHGYRTVVNGFFKKILKKIYIFMFKGAKLIIPPTILYFYKKVNKAIFFNKEPILQEKSENSWGWFGGFESWQDVKRLCNGYDSEIILEKCKNSLLKVKEGLAVYERDSVLFDKIEYSWGLTANLLKIAMENENKLNVLDFGGSLGSSYYQNKVFLTTLKKIKWNIVEQEKFVRCGKVYFENEDLKFYYNIEDCLIENKPNVLILSSVLQYLERPYEWISKFNKLCIEYIIIDSTSFVENDKDIITLQKVPREIYEASYPAWFFNENKFITAFYNYNILYDIYNNFTPCGQLDNKKTSWKGFVLKVKKTNY